MQVYCKWDRDRACIMSSGSYSYIGQVPEKHARRLVSMPDSACDDIDFGALACINIYVDGAGSINNRYSISYDISVSQEPHVHFLHESGIQPCNWHFPWIFAVPGFCICLSISHSGCKSFMMVRFASTGILFRSGWESWAVLRSYRWVLRSKIVRGFWCDLSLSCVSIGSFFLGLVDYLRVPGLCWCFPCVFGISMICAYLVVRAF